MGTGKGAKAEENVTTEESGKNPQVESGSVEEEEPCEKPEEDIDEVAKDIDLKVNITAMWDHHYNAEVELTNLTGERIDDWEISFDFCNKIEHIWNAKDLLIVMKRVICILFIMQIGIKIYRPKERFLLE